MRSQRLNVPTLGNRELPIMGTSWKMTGWKTYKLCLTAVKRQKLIRFKLMVNYCFEAGSNRQRCVTMGLFKWHTSIAKQLQRQRSFTLACICASNKSVVYHEIWNKMEGMLWCQAVDVSLINSSKERHRRITMMYEENPSAKQRKELNIDIQC